MDSHFGFCTFETPVGVIRALRSLGPARPSTHVSGDEESDPKYPLIVTADIATLNSLRSHPDMLETKRDEDILRVLKKLFGRFSWKSNQLLAMPTNAVVDKEELDPEAIKEAQEKKILERREAFVQVSHLH